jgi:hypothetical protein
MKKLILRAGSANSSALRGKLTWASSALISASKLAVRFSGLHSTYQGVVVSNGANKFVYL